MKHELLFRRKEWLETYTAYMKGIKDFIASEENGDSPHFCAKEDERIVIVRSAATWQSFIMNVIASEAWQSQKLNKRILRSLGLPAMTVKS